jgi:hypothetical protein
MAVLDILLLLDYRKRYGLADALGREDQEHKRRRERQLTKKIIYSTVDTKSATNSSAKVFKKLMIFELSKTAGDKVRYLEQLGVEADPAAEEAGINAASAKIFTTSLVSTIVRSGGKVRIIRSLLASWRA